MLRFQSPPASLKSPGKRTPSGVPSKGALPLCSPHRHMLRFQNPSSFIFQSPRYISPLPGSPAGSLWREMLRLHCQWFIHSFISVKSPQLRSPPTKLGKNILSPSTQPHADGRPTYNVMRPGSTRGIVHDTAITTTVPCSFQHNTFHLGLGRPEPR
jgi:hypothetical protein